MNEPSDAPFLHRQFQTLANWLFTVYLDIRVEGTEHVPDEGPVIIAANHPTYLDGAFLMVGLNRPIRFEVGRSRLQSPPGMPADLLLNRDSIAWVTGSPESL